MSVRRTLACAIVALAVSGTGAVAGRVVASGPVANRAPRAVPDPRAQTVYMVTDSVGLSAKGTLPAAFPAGWQVTVDGHPAAFVESLEKTVRQTAAQRPWAIGDQAVVAAGYNYPYWDPARFDRSVDSMIAALEEAGVKQIFWVTLREVKPQYVTPSAWRGVQPYYWYFPEVNEHLRAALARHDDLTLVDWAAVADRPGITYDAIHLNTTGAALYSATIARSVLDARGRLSAGTTTVVPVAGVGGVPPDATAVALNLAVTGARSRGFVTAYPCDEPLPLAANLTFEAAQTVSAAAVVPLSAAGTVCVYNNAATHVIVDVMGSFPAAGGYVRSSPQRLADTRTGVGPVVAGGELRVELPDAVAAVGAAVLNVTAIGGPDAGFVTARPCGTPLPPVSNVNFGAGSTTPNLVVVAPDASGDVCLRVSRSADLVVDLFGGVAPDAVDLPGATRGLDTRDAGALAVPGVDLIVPTGAAGAAGVFLNITATEATADAVLAARPCGQPVPPTANLNVAGGGTRGNAAIVAPDASGKVCVTATAPTHVVVDVLGSVQSGFAGLAAPVRLFDSRPAA